MTVRQAANALQILEYFARRLAPATATEVAEDLCWPRSSTFKLIGTLAGMGYLYEPQTRGSYYPSPRWLILSEKIARADPLPHEFQRLLQIVARKTGETAAISAPSGIHATFVDVIESRHAVRCFAHVGDRVPIHASSAGRALLAQMKPLDRQTLYRKIDFIAYSATTPLSPERVEAELAAAETRGYHQSDAEYTPDLAGVALPLTHPSRHLSIVVVGPVSRCLERREETAKLVATHIKRLGTQST
ncbi:IclR family transcriptional regulator [Sphingomonas oryzagri]|uniref:IclR family transcriptional regulator n=1 Tax=Sphingomonas oryzagri TaxID=3042314 RepID=A0ABT6MY42_9SPHN|nr:IclR family transcriptional regulator [Sphingomonas oryzagri]MDH7637691.1 IclR family transcriptional regulator [Sphingomonas oryzagri]